MEAGPGSPDPPLRNGQPIDRDLEGRTIVLKDVELAIARERREILRGRRTLPKEAVGIRLKSGAPVKIRPLIEVRLLARFI